MKNLKLTIFLAIAMVIASSVHAQKVGYVNTDEILAAMPEVEAATKSIETLRAQLVKKGEDMVNTLRTKYQNLEAKRNELSPKQLNEEAEKLKVEEEALNTFDTESKIKVQSKTEELYTPIQEKVNIAISEVASENGYAYIFDQATGSILYADEASNVTSLVLAKVKE